eukprot:scaffold304657_cov42-Attheya_sp.AAC.1
MKIPAFEPTQLQIVVSSQTNRETRVQTARTSRVDCAHIYTGRSISNLFKSTQLKTIASSRTQCNRAERGNNGGRVVSIRMSRIGHGNIPIRIPPACTPVFLVSTIVVVSIVSIVSAARAIRGAHVGHDAAAAVVTHIGMLFRDGLESHYMYRMFASGGDQHHVAVAVI